MTSPALGLGYYLWRRARWAILAIGLYLLALAAIVRIAPPFSSPLVTIPLLAPLGAAVLYLMAVAQLEPTDLTTKDSCFPAHMRILPVTNCALVLWPMLYAGATLVSVYLLVNWLVLAPTGYALPHFIPAALLAYIVWYQAVVWSPSPVFLLRFLGYIIVTIGLGAFGAAAMKVPFSHNIATACYLALALLAYPVGLLGLTQARRGDGQQWLRLPAFRTLRDLLQRPRRPFRSPITAIVWYECRRNVSLAPLVSILMCLFMLALTLLGAYHDARQSPVSLFPGFPFEITRPIITLFALFPAPLFLFAALSAPLGKFDYFTRNSAFPTFAAIRPISTPRYLLAKFIAVALSVAITLTFLAIVSTVAVALMPPRDRQTLMQMLSIAADAIGIIPLALAVPMFGFIIWRNAATGMFATLTGRPWVSHVLQYGFLGIFALTGIVGYGLFHNRGLLAEIVASFPFLLVAAAVLKLLTSALITLRLRRSQMASATVLAIAAGGWLAIAISLTAALRPMPASLWAIAAATILLIPFNRLAGASLALNWNRHR